MLKKVLEVKLDHNLEKEIIVVNDGSTDSTEDVLKKIAAGNSSIQIINLEKNTGKGASVRRALLKVSGEIAIIQDADLEYDPDDYNKLLQFIVDDHADVVYGSRFIDLKPQQAMFFSQRFSNKLLTFLSNIFTGFHLSDMETCYKMFKTEILKQIQLKENRFGFEPEVTAKLSRIKNIRICETGIAYYGRSYSEGKKINWVDGFRAIWCILKYNIFSRT